MTEPTTAEIRKAATGEDGVEATHYVLASKLEEAETAKYEIAKWTLKQGERLDKAEAKLEAITSYVSTDLFVRLKDLYQVGHDMFGDDLYEIITDLQEMLEKRDD